MAKIKDGYLKYLGSASAISNEQETMRSLVTSSNWYWGYRSKKQRDNPRRILLGYWMLYFSCFSLLLKARKVTIERDVDTRTKAIFVLPSVEKWRDGESGARNGKKKIHALLMLWKALHNDFYAHQGSLHVMEIATVLFLFYLLFILLVAMMRQNAFWDLRHCGFSMSSREKFVFRNISTIIFFRLWLLFSNRSFWIWFCLHRLILNNLKKIKN